MEELELTVVAVVLVVGPGWATNARMPTSMMATSLRISDAGVDGEATVCRRTWTSPGATKLCAMLIAALRSLIWLVVRIESATRSLRRMVMAS